MSAKRVCSEPACPVLTDSGRCIEHRRQVDRGRGTRQQRGYDRAHVRGRAAAIRKASPSTACARCALPLGPDYEASHYDHSDNRRTYIGLSHPHCNVAAGGRSAHG